MERSNTLKPPRALGRGPALTKEFANPLPLCSGRESSVGLAVPALLWPGHRMPRWKQPGQRALQPSGRKTVEYCALPSERQLPLCEEEKSTAHFCGLGSPGADPYGL